MNSFLILSVRRSGYFDGGEPKGRKLAPDRHQLPKVRIGVVTVR